MKILIVDDEALVRLGMQSIIPWELHGYEVIGTASTGIEALKMAKNYPPDIVLADIVMPEMDGLEFIHQLHNDLPLCKFIILSCKDDIEYYRKAIKEGVSEYLQKSSLNPYEILQAVNRVSNEIRKQRVFDNSDSPEKTYINQNIILTEFLNSVLRGQIKGHKNIEEKLYSYKFKVPFETMYIIELCVDMPEDSEESYEGTYDYSLISISQQIINDMADGYVFKNYNFKITALVVLPDGSDAKSHIRNILYRIQETVSQMFFLKITAGVSNMFNSFDGFYEAYRQAHESIEEKYKKGIEKVYFYKNPRNYNNNDNILYKILEEKKNILNIKSSSELQSFYQKIMKITQLFSESENISSMKFKEILIDILYHIIYLLRVDGIEIKQIMGVDFNPVEYIVKFQTLSIFNKNIENTFRKIEAYYHDTYSNDATKIISSINSYIDQHVSEKILLDYISKEVHLTPAYISRLYKKKTGENIQDYIARAKVEKSKQLLRKNISLFEVSEGVGFLSLSHFFKVFKAYTGLTPGEYLKKLK